jgi:hypothetical protein
MESRRRERLTYPGAFRHVMKRGINGEYIFPGDRDKEAFLKFLFMQQRVRSYIITLCAFLIPMIDLLI